MRAKREYVTFKAKRGYINLHFLVIFHRAVAEATRADVKHRIRGNLAETVARGE